MRTGWTTRPQRMNTDQHGWEGVARKGAKAQSIQNNNLCNRCNLWINFLVFLTSDLPTSNL
jgi:hypothetical protein